MLRRHRARRGPYTMAAPSVLPSVIRSLVLLSLLAFLLYITAKGVLWMFDGNSVQQTPAQLTVEQGGTVNVAVDDGLLQRIEDPMKIYQGDRIVSASSGFADIRFFDGSMARIDAQSDMKLTASDDTDDQRTWSVTAAKGAVWVRTPDAKTYSGSITRTVVMPRYSVTLTTDTEAVVEESKLLVFSADGQGVAVKITGRDTPFYIGEGQQLALPEGDIGSDPYAYRSAIEPLAVQRDFIEKSRTMFSVKPPVTGTGSTTTDTTEPLTVTAPVNGITVTTSTVKVSGNVGSTVQRVRVNGNDATILANRTFSLELSLQQATSTTISIEAFDARGLSLAQQSVVVYKGSQTVGVPSITSPAAGGQIYRTQKDEISVSGSVPAGTAGVMVNDYRLQLFRSGDTTWSYLASKALGNLKDGANVFSVVALDAAGNRSAAVQITINVEAGTEGVIGGTAASTSSVAQVQESDLPTNDPLMPGTIAVTGPLAGSTFTATGSEFLLEGTTPSATASVWVNGYKLQLYKAGKTAWNYIAKAEFNTLKPGTNVYKIVARDAKNMILDRFEYTVTYTP